MSAAIPENCFEMKIVTSPGRRERDPASDFVDSKGVFRNANFCDVANAPNRCLRSHEDSEHH